MKTLFPECQGLWFYKKLSVASSKGRNHATLQKIKQQADQ
jgi:hypothetical protein